MLRATNIKKGTISEIGLVYVDLDEVPKGRDARLKTNDIVVVRSGAYTGDSAIVPSAFEGAIAGYDMVVRSNHDTSPTFMAWALLSQPLLESQIHFDCMRAAQPHLNAEELGDVLVPIPGRNIQQRIADYLDHETAEIDALIAEKEQMLALLEEKRAALVTHAVTRGLDPDAPLKPSGLDWLGDVPAHWITSRLKYLATVRTGLTIGKDYKGQNLNDYYYLRVANVQDGYLSLDDLTTVAVPESEAMSCLLAPGDVLMNEGGDIDKLGRGCVWRGEVSPCLHQNHVFCVRPHSVDSEWLTTFTATKTAKLYFESRAKRTTNLASISSSNIKEITVPLPPPNEQRQIMDVLARKNARIDDVRTATEQAVRLLRERRSALITAAITGQLPTEEMSA